MSTATSTTNLNLAHLLHLDRLKSAKRRARASIAAVDIPVPATPGSQLNPEAGVRQLHHAPTLERRAVLDRAFSRARRRHGGPLRMVATFITAHTRWWAIAAIILRNPMLWTLLLAVAISASGLRRWLDPASPQYVLELGWLISSLLMLTNTCVPLALFSNGVWLHGKRFWEGNVKKGLIILAIKIVVLPWVQAACAKACGLSTAAGMSLVLLAICPCASTSFVIASKYNHGPEIVTFVTVLSTVLLVPLVLAALYIPPALGIYDYDTGHFPMT